jgi:dihydrofolate reductase
MLSTINSSSILPDEFRPLPDRQNIVLTRSGFEPGETEVAESLKEAWERAENEKVFIIGAASIFKQAIEEVDKMLITEVPGEYEGDTYFPDFSGENWREVSREEKDGISFVEYSRKD